MEQPRSPSRYQGKNLFRLVAATGFPALFFYLRIVFATIPAISPVSASEKIWLFRASNVALILSIPVLLICANYVRSELKPARTKLGSSLQFVAVLLVCSLCAVAGALMLEAIGFNLFVRAMRVRH